MKLRKDGYNITERTEILQAWEKHFCLLSKTRIRDTSVGQALQDDYMQMTHDSLNNEDYVFDIEFEAEEVEKAIECLPNGKAVGPDGVLVNI